MGLVWRMLIRIDGLVAVDVMWFYITRRGQPVYAGKGGSLTFVLN